MGYLAPLLGEGAGAGAAGGAGAGAAGGASLGSIGAEGVGAAGESLGGSALGSATGYGMGYNPEMLKDLGGEMGKSPANTPMPGPASPARAGGMDLITKSGTGPSGDMARIGALLKPPKGQQLDLKMGGVGGMRAKGPIAPPPGAGASMGYRRYQPGGVGSISDMLNKLTQQ